MVVLTRSQAEPPEPRIALGLRTNWRQFCVLVLVNAFVEPDARRTTIESDRLRAFREGIPALMHVGAFRPGGANLRLPSGEVALISAAHITPDSFSVLPYAPIVGRAMSAAHSTVTFFRSAG